MAEAAAILEIEVETGGTAQGRNGRNVEGEDIGLLDAHEAAHGPADDRLDRLVGAFALAPVTQLGEDHADVLALAGKDAQDFVHDVTLCFLDTLQAQEIMQVHRTAG